MPNCRQTSQTARPQRRSPLLSCWRQLVLTALELGEYIDRHLTRSAFRLEVLDRYDVAADGVDFERFLRGEPEPMRERKKPWLDHLRRERASGILRHRVHVLRTPLTDYLRY